MAVRVTHPKATLLVHSDQGIQYNRADYVEFLQADNIKPAISHRGNCHDSAVSEGFFATLIKRVIQRKIYLTRDEAKTGIFYFIEMFYKLIKRHSHT